MYTGRLGRPQAYLCRPQNADCRGHDLQNLRETARSPSTVTARLSLGTRWRCRERSWWKELSSSIHCSFRRSVSADDCHPVRLKAQRFTSTTPTSRRSQQGDPCERKDALVCFEPTCRHMVHAMKCGGVPTQPTYNHQSTRSLCTGHGCIRVDGLLTKRNVRLPPLTTLCWLWCLSPPGPRGSFGPRTTNDLNPPIGNID